MTLTKWILIAAGVLASGAVVVTLLALRDTRAKIESLERDGCLADTRHGRIEYATWGDGEPVLVLHGAGGGFDQGRLLARSLGPANIRWVSISRFGYLGSDLPREPSTAAQAEAIADLLATLQIDRTSILAMSGGVPPALKFAEMYPHTTDRLVLLSSAPFTPFSPDIEDRPIPTWAYSALLGNDIVYWTLTRIARGMLANAFDARPALRVDLSHAERAFVSDLIDGFLPASERMAGVGNEGAAVDPAAVYDLESISAPVLVVHAKDDRLNPYDIGAALAEGIGGARLITLTGGGHLLLGHHARLKAEIASFLHEDSGVGQSGEASD